MKNILIVTSSRSEFGILKNIILKISRSKKINSRLVVTGSHFNSKFGKTYDEIKKSKIKNILKIKIKMGKTSSKNSSLIASNLISKFSNLLLKFKPDAVVIFGDRFEILALAYASFLHKIPILHIGGGEKTQGSIDDSIRHAVSKLSSFHFVSHQMHKSRLIQLGEEKKNIYVIGSTGIENIKNTKILKKNEIEKKYKFKFLKKNILVNFYPITNEKNKDKIYIKELLNSLSHFTHFRIIFTLPAFEVGSDIIIEEIKKFKKNNKNVLIFKSLGSINYLSILKYSNMIIGNSSSGLIEAPILGTKVINIGQRQKGRIRPKEIVNIKCEKKMIIKTINKNLNKKIKFKRIYPNINSSLKFLKILESLNLKNSFIKDFKDMN